MKFRSIITGVFLLSVVTSGTRVEAKDISILFLGNSFTNRHDIPDLVEKILEEGDPETDVHVSRVIYGGQNMFKHSTYYFSQSFIEQATISNEEISARIGKMQEYLQSETAPNPEEWKEHWDAVGKKAKFADIHNHIKRAVKNHENLLADNPKTKWDYVVLQSWQDIAEDPLQGYGKYAPVLADVAKKSGAEVILYMTSPKTQNREPVEAPVSPESADRALRVGLDLVKRISPKAVVHVPLAIKKIQTGGTDLVFRYVNDGHPNQTCAFLTSNLFYAAFTGKSPEGLKFDTIVENKVKDGKDPDGGPLKVVFEGETKAYLQKMAFEATQEFNQLAAGQ
ncbi:MAG: hypothetical protein P1V20_09105 [Verrucomicrobiales bacterium]|nr:hypothetical protein [Verrucomicrobiales bacterium]